uniref:X protein n=1 Tax=Simian erythroparvovirus 2 TaxID=1920706 RepID=A0A1W5PTC6_9VIRU|nr:X protein [Simian erythroparvovirus 2]
MLLIKIVKAKVLLALIYKLILKTIKIVLIGILWICLMDLFQISEKLSQNMNPLMSLEQTTQSLLKKTYTKGVDLVLSYPLVTTLALVISYKLGIHKVWWMLQLGFMISGILNLLNWE